MQEAQQVSKIKNPSVEDEYKKILSAEGIKNRTEAVIKELEIRGEELINTATKTALKDYTLTMNRDMEIREKALTSKKVTKVTINKTTGKLSITLINGFVNKVMSIIYKCDFNAVYDAVNSDFSKLSAFNLAISEQLKEKAEFFVRRI